MLNFLHKKEWTVTKSKVAWSDYASGRLTSLMDGAPNPELTFLCDDQQTAERLAKAFDENFPDHITLPELLKFPNGKIAVLMVFATEADVLSYASSMASGFGSTKPMHLSGGLAAGLSEANGRMMRKQLHIPVGGFSLGSAFMF